MNEGDIEAVEVIEANQQHDKLVTQLTKNVRHGDEVRKFYNSNAGKELRAFITAGKQTAMEDAVGDDPSKRSEGRQDFKVLQRVESLFAAMIIQSNESLNQLEQLESDYIQQTIGDDNG